MSDQRNQQTDGSRSIAFECDLPEPPEKVWRALTTAEIVSDWLLPTDLKPEPGAEFTFRDPSAERPIRCRVLSVEPERSIRFSWRDAEARREALDSTVIFEIARTEAGGTHLRIVHEVTHAATAAPQAFAANDNSIQSRLAA